MRQTIFAKRFKLPETRLTEQGLLARAEILKLRISLLQQERNRRKLVIEDIKVSYIFDKLEYFKNIPIPIFSEKTKTLNYRNGGKNQYTNAVLS